MNDQLWFNYINYPNEVQVKTWCAIIWTNAEYLLIRTVEINLIEMLILNINVRGPS